MEAKKIQSGPSWAQDNGSLVDKKRLFPYEVKAERTAVRLYNKALKIQELLNDLMEDAENSVTDVQTKYEQSKPDSKEFTVDKSFTFYSFDREVKVEKVVQALTGHREEEIAMSKEYFEKYINEIEYPGDNIIVLKRLVMDAFTTKSGKFDYKKLDALIGYKDKTDNEIFQKAISLLDGAKYEKRVKTYYNIYIRDKEGVYKQVNLRLSGAN